MFPLGSVLLPGGLLPLHVFEPRYRQLVIDCLAADDGDPEFGVTMIERGWEVGGGDERTNVGVVARMVQVDALDDGRYALVAVGTRRIRVNAWLPDDPYPLADVDDWPDDDPDADELPDRVGSAADRLRSVLELAVDVGDLPRSPTSPSATIRCWPRTTSPGSPRSVRPTASACSAPGRRRSGSTCSTRPSTTSRRCCGSGSLSRRARPVPADGRPAGPLQIWRSQRDRTADVTAPRTSARAARDEPRRSATSSTSSRRTPSRRRSARCGRRALAGDGRGRRRPRSGSAWSSCCSACCA